MKQAHFYHDKPLFGLDIGFGNMKVMQIELRGGKKCITGYGVTTFAPEAIKDGVIEDIEVLARAAQDLFAKHLIGNISTKRVAVSVPAVRTFNRTLQLPKMSHKDLGEAVRSETEQYIPVPIDELYTDYSIIKETDEGIELLMVAAPRKIVQSYLDLTEVLGLEPVAIETTIGAASRLFIQDERSDLPAILIDFGSMSSDITVYDRTIVVTSTVQGGGDAFTNALVNELKVTPHEANLIKTKYGLRVSKKQAEITAAMEPVLGQLVKEIRRMVRYHEERSSSERKISQIITMGGGANMPGLSDYLTNALRMPTRMYDTWYNLSFDKLQPPHATEKTMFITVAGLALMQPKEVFA